MLFNHINHLLHRQQLLSQAESMVFRLPEMGLKADSLAIMPIDQLVGTLAFLKRSYAERQAL